MATSGDFRWPPTGRFSWPPSRLLAWTRVRHRQAWLGLDGEPVRRIGSDEVVDLDATRRLPWPAQLDMAFNVVERETPLNAERINALRELVEANSSPELPELLLADAQFIASSAEPPDPSRALLIAAVACEVKIRAFLRTSATAEQAPLMELLLSNPRDWSLAAAALFDKTAQDRRQQISQGGARSLETHQKALRATQCIGSPG